MVWPCRLIQYAKEHTGATLQVGDMFLLTPPSDITWEHDPDGWWWPEAYTKNLSDYYYQHNSGRPPILVFLPGRILFCVDSKCWKDRNYYGGWQVSGTPPNITVSPSIDIQGTYHGFLQNGVIQDDVNGRKYDSEGRLI